MAANFNAVYPSGLQVGIPGSAGFSMLFTAAPSLLVYLPTGGAPAALTQDLTDPGSTPAGVFGGLVVALKLNIDFADAGLTLGTSGIPFGDLTICSFSDPLPNLNGLTVRQYLASVNTALGGGLAIYAIDPHLTNVTSDVDLSFQGGSPSQFAQDHIVSGACP
jgi:hypothetical protein